MNPVFLDTAGLIAVWDSTDQWHPLADAAYQELLKQGRKLVTTHFVLLETGNAAARRPYRKRVNILRECLAKEGLLLEPTADEIAEASYDRAEAGYAGIVDHVSFVVMRRMGITEAFTNDRHFKAAGFSLLIEPNQT